MLGPDYYQFPLLGAEPCNQGGGACDVVALARWIG